MKDLKRLLQVNLVLVLFFISSCSDENVKPTSKTPDDTSSQGLENLQGMIKGVSFKSKGGRVEIVPDATNDPNNTQDLFIQLFDVKDKNDVCAVTFRGINYVSFRPPLEVGIHKLYFDEETSYNNGVTFVVPGDPNNYNAYTGEIEIISIEDTKVTGKIDATLDSGTWIKGEFEVAFCP